MNSKIIYFCPTVSTGHANELESIQSVVDTLEPELEDTISIVPTWEKLMVILQDSSDKRLLIVFRLDFLERTNLLLDEVLSMLSVLTKFVNSTKQVDIAVVVPKPCNTETLSKLKRNNVLGIIPGIRFFDKKHSINAYKILRTGESHWPSIAIQTTCDIYKRNEIGLTKRQYEIFNLVAKRGLSNKKIGSILGITEATVKIHVGTILKRFGLKNRTQLALANSTGTIK